MTSIPTSSFRYRKTVNALIACSLSACPLLAQTTGSSVTGGSATGGSVTGGSVTGGSATGGSVTGGSVTGGSVTGGSATGGSVTGGTVTPGTVTPGTVSATVGGRQISATGEGSVSVQADGDHATVKLDSHLLRIEKDRLVLDGKERAKLPVSAAKLQVTSAKGRITVTADGREVFAGNADQPR